jgi:hypothetical protein
MGIYALEVGPRERRLYLESEFGIGHLGLWRGMETGSYSLYYIIHPFIIRGWSGGGEREGTQKFGKWHGLSRLGERRARREEGIQDSERKREEAKTRRRGWWSVYGNNYILDDL